MKNDSVKTDDAKVGMILASDVTLDNGSMLLGKGTELDEHKLALLKKRGIDKITVAQADEPIPSTGKTGFVKKDSDAEAEESQPTAGHAALERLEQVFSGIADDKYMNSIYEEARTRAATIESFLKAE